MTANVILHDLHLNLTSQEIIKLSWTSQMTRWRFVSFFFFRGGINNKFFYKKVDRSENDFSLLYYISKIGNVICNNILKVYCFQYSSATYASCSARCWILQCFPSIIKATSVKHWFTHYSARRLLQKLKLFYKDYFAVRAELAPGNKCFLRFKEIFSSWTLPEPLRQIFFCLKAPTESEFSRLPHGLLDIVLCH